MPSSRLNKQQRQQRQQHQSSTPNELTPTSSSEFTNMTATVSSTIGVMASLNAQQSSQNEQIQVVSLQPASAIIPLSLSTSGTAEGSEAKQSTVASTSESLEEDFYFVDDKDLLPDEQNNNGKYNQQTVKENQGLKM